MFRASLTLPTYAKPFLSRRVKKHRAINGAKEPLSDDSYKDILAHLLGSRDEETNTNYSESELLGEAILLMIAGASNWIHFVLGLMLIEESKGSDTSSTAVSAALFYICHHPAVQRKLLKELSDAFASAKDIKPVSTENCKYLRACLEEAMRLCPPSPTNIPRLVGPSGVKVADQHIPEGIYVGVPNFTVFRNQECFERPHDFFPERWIADPAVGRSEETIKPLKATFMPFSLGPRQCIGRHLAIREASYTLAKIFFMFDIEVIGEDAKLTRKLPGMENQVTMEQFDVFTSVEKGPFVRLRMRKEVVPCESESLWRSGPAITKV